MVNPDIEKWAFGRLVLSFRLVAHAISHVAWGHYHAPATQESFWWEMQPENENFSGGEQSRGEKNQPKGKDPDSILILTDGLRPKFVTNLWKLSPVKIRDII